VWGWWGRLGWRGEGGGEGPPSHRRRGAGVSGLWVTASGEGGVSVLVCVEVVGAGMSGGGGGGRRAGEVGGLRGGRWLESREWVRGGLMWGGGGGKGGGAGGGGPAGGGAGERWLGVGGRGGGVVGAGRG